MRAPKPLDLPAAVAHAFVEDALAYFDEKDHIKRDTIAVKQLRALKQLQGPREKPLTLADVKAMFREMKGTGITKSPAQGRAERKYPSSGNARS